MLGDSDSVLMDQRAREQVHTPARGSGRRATGGPINLLNVEQVGHLLLNFTRGSQSLENTIRLYFRGFSYSTIHRPPPLLSVTPAAYSFSPSLLPDKEATREKEV